MSKIRITLVALGIAAAIASVPAFAVTGAEGNDRYAVAEEITIEPGHAAGWETRLGRTVVIVKQGTLTLARGTDPSYAEDVYAAGDAYLESGRYRVTVGRNEGITPLVIVVAHVDVDSADA